LGLIYPFGCLGVDVVEGALERGIDDAEAWKCGGDTRTQDAIVSPNHEEKERVGNPISAKVGIANLFNEHTDEDGATVFRHACKLGFEGIVSKRLTAPYRSGPSRDWIKVKNPDSPAMRRHGPVSGSPRVEFHGQCRHGEPVAPPLSRALAR
jgi:hypothetical protein